MHLLAHSQKWKGNAQFSSMEFNGTSVTPKKVLKRVQTYSQLEH